MGRRETAESYSAERQPIGARAINHTSDFHISHGKFHDGFAAIEDDSPEGRALRAEVGPELVREVGRMFRTIGLQLGYRYEDSPIIVPDDTEPVPDDPENFVASARPGSRAPHVALTNGISTLDLYGRGFVLARFGQEAPEDQEIVEAAKARGAQMRRSTTARLQLSMKQGWYWWPDGHVAWRGNDAPDDPMAVIDRIRGC
jgi:hypothetical protein